MTSAMCSVEIESERIPAGEELFEYDQRYFLFKYPT